MLCPYCKGPTRVTDSRTQEGKQGSGPGAQILSAISMKVYRHLLGGVRRRRECDSCRRRFTTLELTVHQLELIDVNIRKNEWECHDCGHKIRIKCSCKE